MIWILNVPQRLIYYRLVHWSEGPGRWWNMQDVGPSGRRLSHWESVLE
jgi:hypothetical protein